MSDKTQQALVKEENPSTEVQVWREFEHSMLDLERRMDRVLREAFGEGRETWKLPLLSGLSLQRGPNGIVRFRPFGHLQETVDKILAGWREPVLTWTTDEEKGEVEFRCEVPGLGKDDLKVEVQPESIRVEGTRKDTKYRAECTPGLRLNPEKAEARYEHGILHLKVGLAPAATKGRTVQIH
jgi:HSP20 family protein